MSWVLWHRLIRRLLATRRLKRRDDFYIYCCKGANQTVRAKLVANDGPGEIARVLNFGFEKGQFVDWRFVTASGAVVNDNGPSASGAHAASVSATLAGGFEQAVTKAIPIESGEELEFAF